MIRSKSILSSSIARAYSQMLPKLLAYGIWMALPPGVGPEGSQPPSFRLPLGVYLPGGQNSEVRF